MRLALPCGLLSVLTACASTFEPRVAGDATNAFSLLRSTTEGRGSDAAAPAAATSGAARAETPGAWTWPGPAEPAPAAAEPLLPRRDGGVLGESYTALRLASFSPDGDVDALDTGYWAEIGFGRRIAKLFAVEAATGFYRLTGDNGAEIHGVPLLINGRVGLPVLIFEPYVGAGVGGIWAHAELNNVGDKDSFAGLYDAFLGVEVGLGNWGVGLEYRYLHTADLDSPGGFGDFQLEGHIVSITGKLGF